MNRAADHLSVCFFFCMISSVTSQPCCCICLFFTAFTWTNYTRVSGDCTRVSHNTNTSACRNSTVSPKRSPVTSSSRWTWARWLLTLHSWSETTLTHKMAFLGISMSLFQKQILPTCQEWCSCCLCKVCSSLEQKKGYERAIAGSKIILMCPLLCYFCCG